MDRGEFTIDIPDPRGAISLHGGRLSIVNAFVPLRLTGQIDGKPFDLRNGDETEIDDKNIRSVELWLLAKGSDLVDYLSTTHWPYKYEVTPQEAAQEQKLFELIRCGESELCEFKPYIDLTNQKALEIEKTVCAFSNQNGGTLFIGVNDEGEIVGLAKELSRHGRKKGQNQRQDLNALITGYEKEVRARLRESLKDNQCCASRVATVSGTQLIVVEVQRSADVNCLVRSEIAQIAFIRRGATNAKMSPAEIQAKGGDNVSSVLSHHVFGS